MCVRHRARHQTQWMGRRGLRYTEIHISKKKKKKATPLTAWKVNGTHGSLFYDLKRKGVLSAPKSPHRCHNSQFESPWTSKRSWSSRNQIDGK